jgi:peptidoglycan L-alanyl-D-glutamate endopeptidase CwlK
MFYIVKLKKVYYIFFSGKNRNLLLLIFNKFLDILKPNICLYEILKRFLCITRSKNLISCICYGKKVVPSRGIEKGVEMRDVKLLHPDLQPKALRLIELAKAKGINIIITQTWRTKEEQDALYAQGRTRSGNIVTNVKYPHSLHCWGLAFDIAVTINGKVNWSAKYYDIVGPIGESLGLEWGGRWKNFVDRPHFQLPGFSVANLIAKYHSPEMFKKSWKKTSGEVKNVAGFEGKAKVVFEGKTLSAGILAGKTYVELRALAELLGLKVNWDNGTKTVTLSK